MFNPQPSINIENRQIDTANFSHTVQKAAIQFNQVQQAMTQSHALYKSTKINIVHVCTCARVCTRRIFPPGRKGQKRRTDNDNATPTRRTSNPRTPCQELAPQQICAPPVRPGAQTRQTWTPSTLPLHGGPWHTPIRSARAELFSVRLGLPRGGVPVP